MVESEGIKPSLTGCKPVVRSLTPAPHENAVGGFTPTPRGDLAHTRPERARAVSHLWRAVRELNPFCLIDSQAACRLLTAPHRWSRQRESNSPCSGFEPAASACVGYAGIEELVPPLGFEPRLLAF